MPKITVKDVPQLPYKTRFPNLVFDTPGNSYMTENIDGCTDEDVSRWYFGGFINVEGLEPGPDPNPDKPIVIDADKIKLIATKRSPE